MTETCAIIPATAFRPGLENHLLPLDRGRRESRAPEAPVDPARRSTRASRMQSTRAKYYRYRRSHRLSPRNGFTAYFVLTPGNGLSCPGCQARTGRPDRRQGRGARSTRLRRTLRRFAWRETRLTPQASIATRTTLRDEGVSSLMAARAGRAY